MSAVTDQQTHPLSRRLRALPRQGGSPVTPHPPILDLSCIRSALEDAVEAIVLDLGQDVSDETLVNNIYRYKHLLPVELAIALEEFRLRDNSAGAILLRNLPIYELAPTPLQPGEGIGPSGSRALQALIGSGLGDQVCFKEESSGAEFQNIYPTRSAEEKQESGSSRAALLFHTETAFHPYRADYLFLQCLRQDHDAVALTTLVCVHAIVSALSPTSIIDLSRPEFATAIDSSFGGGESAHVEAVLGGHPLAPTLRYDADLMTGLTARARLALQELGSIVDSLSSGIALRQGDALLVDNNRAVHSRSEFTARYDGQDRWLQRSFISRDLTRSAAHREPGSRVIHLDPVVALNS